MINIMLELLNSRMVTLYKGTTEKEFSQIIIKKCPNITWWTTDIEEAKFFSPFGLVLKMHIKLDKTLQNDKYLTCLNEYYKEYNYGIIKSKIKEDNGEIPSEIKTFWYSISKDYLYKYATIQKCNE